MINDLASGIFSNSLCYIPDGCKSENTPYEIKTVTDGG